MEREAAHTYTLGFLEREGVNYQRIPNGQIEAWAGGYYSSRAVGADKAKAYQALVATLVELFLYCESEADLLPPNTNYQPGDFQKNLKAFFDMVAAEFDQERLLVNGSEPDLPELEDRPD